MKENITEEIRLLYVSYNIANDSNYRNIENMK